MTCHRQNAEDDLSNIYHLQSIYPSAQSRESSKQQFVKSPVGSSAVTQLETFPKSGVGLLLMGDEDDLFALEDVHLPSVRSHQSSEEEREDSEQEPDEGIHIPGKFRNKTHIEVS